MRRTWLGQPFVHTAARRASEALPPRAQLTIASASCCRDARRRHHVSKHVAAAGGGGSEAAGDVAQLAALERHELHAERRPRALDAHAVTLTTHAPSLTPARSLAKSASAVRPSRRSAASMSSEPAPKRRHSPPPTLTSTRGRAGGHSVDGAEGACPRTLSPVRGRVGVGKTLAQCRAAARDVSDSPMRGSHVTSNANLTSPRATFSAATPNGRPPRRAAARAAGRPRGAGLLDGRQLLHRRARPQLPRGGVGLHGDAAGRGRRAGDRVGGGADVHGDHGALGRRVSRLRGGGVPGHELGRRLQRRQGGRHLRGRQLAGGRL